MTAAVLSREGRHLCDSTRAAAATRMNTKAKLPSPKQSQIRKRPSRKPSFPEPLCTAVAGDIISGSVSRLWSAFQVKR